MIHRAIRHVRSWFRVKPLPVTYRGVRMASTLEADWANTFESLGWSWSYEPIGLRLSDGQCYRCDFYLPAQRVWCEIKGPHNLRVDKPLTLWRDLRGDEGDLRGDEGDWREPLVVICREPLMGEAVVERADGQPIGIADCGRCGIATFVDLHGAWQCRICGFWEERTGGVAGVAFAPVAYSWREAA